MVFLLFLLELKLLLFLRFADLSLFAFFDFLECAIPVKCFPVAFVVLVVGALTRLEIVDPGFLDFSPSLLHPHLHVKSVVLSFVSFN